jgi:predicted nucleic acid-binding protein
LIYLLDASALVKYLSASPDLTPQAKSIIDDPGSENRLAVPSICLVEVWDVARKKRRGFSNYSLVTETICSKGISVEVLNVEVVQLLPDLWEDTHDMIILATALELEARYGQGSVTVISSDEKIRHFQSLVPCVW